MPLIMSQTLDDKGNYYECKQIHVTFAKFMGTMYAARILLPQSLMRDIHNKKRFLIKTITLIVSADVHLTCIQFLKTIFL